MDDGYIKLHRKLLDSPVWGCSPETIKVFMGCLFLANWKDQRFYSTFHRREIIIKRGSFVSNWKKLSEHVGISVQTTRTCVLKLVNLEILTRCLTGKLTTFSVLNYDAYQKVPTGKLTGCLTDSQQIANRMLTTSKPFSVRAHARADVKDVKKLKEREEARTRARTAEPDFASLKSTAGKDIAEPAQVSTALQEGKALQELTPIPEPAVDLNRTFPGPDVAEVDPFDLAVQRGSIRLSGPR